MKIDIYQNGNHYASVYDENEVPCVVDEIRGFDSDAEIKIERK